MLSVWISLKFCPSIKSLCTERDVVFFFYKLLEVGGKLSFIIEGQLSVIAVMGNLSLLFYF